MTSLVPFSCLTTCPANLTPEETQPVFRYRLYFVADANVTTCFSPSFCPFGASSLVYFRSAHASHNCIDHCLYFSTSLTTASFPCTAACGVLVTSPEGRHRKAPGITFHSTLPSVKEHSTTHVSVECRFKSHTLCGFKRRARQEFF